jgi:hypothetical protein
MANLLRRAEELARAGQQRKITQVAQRVRELLRGVSIEIEETRVIVSGSGILKRWLLDPALRFLSGELK